MQALQERQLEALPEQDGWGDGEGDGEAPPRQLGLELDEDITWNMMPLPEQAEVEEELA